MVLLGAPPHLARSEHAPSHCRERLPHTHLRGFSSRGSRASRASPPLAGPARSALVAAKVIFLPAAVGEVGEDALYFAVRGVCRSFRPPLPPPERARAPRARPIFVGSGHLPPAFLWQWDRVSCHRADVRSHALLHGAFESLYVYSKRPARTGAARSAHARYTVPRVGLRGTSSSAGGTRKMWGTRRPGRAADDSEGVPDDEEREPEPRSRRDGGNVQPLAAGAVAAKTVLGRCWARERTRREGTEAAAR